MYVRSNLSSLRSWRSLVGAYAQMDRTHSHLASGLRINSAADDAPGLAISQRLMAQVRGLNQANRNVMDGISLINTAEGAMQTIHTLLHRGNELAMQAANGVLTAADRQFLQAELNSILSEIDRIADATSFNGQQLLGAYANSAAIAATMNGLQSGWLEQSEALISTFYGISGDGSGLRVVLENSGAQSAWISGTPGVGGRLDNLTLHINLADFGAAPGPDGGTGPVYNDRKVARALTQAVLARNSNFNNLEAWFASGVADYIAGRDEQLAADVAQYGAAAVVNAIGSWSEDSLHHSSAYLAVKYLDSQLAPLGMADVMQELSWGNDLNAALMNTLGIDVTTFLADFQANGAAFLGTLDLNDPDVGGIGGRDAAGVVPNGGTFSTSPLAGFAVNWATGASDPVSFTLQVGANAGESISFAIPQVSSASLGLLGLDLVGNAGAALTKFQAAINQVSQARAYLGGVTNRLERIVAVNQNAALAQQEGYSRITDADFAREVVNLTRQQILASTAAAMLSQANSSRQTVYHLLSARL